MPASDPVALPRSRSRTTKRRDLVVACEVDRSGRSQVKAIIESIRREVSREHELIVDCVVLLKSGAESPKPPAARFNAMRVAAAVLRRQRWTWSRDGTPFRKRKSGCQTSTLGVQRPQFHCQAGERTVAMRGGEIA